MRNSASAIRVATGFTIIEMMIVLAIIGILGATFLSVYLKPSPTPCIEWRTETVITYPNMGLIGLGPQYTAIALTPVYEQQRVCVQRLMP